MVEKITYHVLAITKSGIHFAQWYEGESEPYSFDTLEPEILREMCHPDNLTAYDRGFNAGYEAGLSDGRMSVNNDGAMEDIADALEESADWMEAELKNIGGCDHAVNICVCGDRSTLAGHRELIAKVRASLDPPHQLNTLPEVTELCNTKGGGK